MLAPMRRRRAALVSSRLRSLVLAWALASTLGCGRTSTADPRPIEPRATASVGDDTAPRGEDGPPAPSPDPAPAVGRLAWAHAIADPATWSRLASRPSTATVARTEVVKFLLDREDGRTLWFVDTDRWEIHFDFAVDMLGVPSGYRSHDLFNTREYRRPERRFEMGSLVHYLDGDLWTLELVAGDNLDGPHLARLFEDVRAAVFFGDRLRFRPLSPLHDATVASIPGRLPLVRADEVFRGVSYQPLTFGEAFGTLRIVRGALDPASVRPDEILVLEHLPDDIGVVSGVISAELEAPLGHVAILCATRGTPNMGLRSALTDERLSALEGQLVRLVVAPQEWSVGPATREQAEASWASRRPARTSTPPIDASERRLRPVRDVRIGDVRTVGAKAAQLGEVTRLGGIETPGGFTVPFSYYLAHVERAGVGAELRAIFADASLTTDRRALAQRLAAVRAAITSTPVDPALLRGVRERVLEAGRGRRFIFRSSTNAEDLPGFTGAGLYRSIVVSAGASDDEIADAMRGVWASVWLLGAYEEREWYRVEQGQVAMALLVQPFVDGALVNGVAITANPFFEGRPGFFVNAEPLGGSVTGASGDEIPEQHVIYMYSEVVESELVTRSTRSPDAELLTEAEIVRLASVLRRLHCGFRQRWLQLGEDVPSTRALDVEYLIAGADRHVVILQARPYDVRYEASQRVEGIDLCAFVPSAPRASGVSGVE